MTISSLIIIVIALATIVGGIMLLKKSAKRFNLSADALARIKKRNKVLDEQEEQEKND